MGKNLYASVTGISDPLAITVSTSHSASTASATIQCINPTVSIGDLITIDLGYTTSHGQIFKGYIKNIVRQVPDNIYTVMAKDVLIRAVDFFIVPTNPDEGYSQSNITAEDLIEDILNMAGLTSYSGDNSAFTFATKSGNKVEVKLTSAYDFCKLIADLLAWQVWADENGTVHFKNRKPRIMDGTSGQVGDPPGGVPDSPVATITDSNIFDFIYTESERDLRNRVVVHGAEGVYAESKSGTSYNPVTDAMEQILPVGYYKSMALVSPIIDSDSMAEAATDYNLDMYNRLTVSIQAQVEGSHLYLARKTLTVNEIITGINRDFYVFLSEHAWSKNGYTCNLELRI